jgi:hypothetical protein
MEPDGSLLYSQELAIGSYPYAYKSVHILTSTSLRSILILSYYRRFEFASSEFPTEIYMYCNVSHARHMPPPFSWFVEET